MLRLTAVALSATCALGLAACGGGGGGSSSSPPPPPAAYTVGATVSGLSGAGLALSNNGSDTVSVSASGAVTFGKSLAAGSAYSVAVVTQPSSPSQTCVVANGAGTVSSANVTTVSVTCTTNSYAVQPAVTGLSGSGLVLQDAFADNLTVTQSGAATFANKVQSGAAYNVSVLTQPSNPVQTCTVANGSGTVTNAGVAPTVSCFTPLPWTLLTLNYNDNSVSLFALDPATGQPRSRGAVGVSAWPAGGSPTDITGDGQGRFIYVLNSGAGSIASFQIDPVSGSLQSSGTQAAGTKPVSLTGYPNTKVLYAVNSGSNDISVYAIDQTTGVLTPVSGGPFKAGTTPFKLTLDAAGRYAYVTNSGSNDIYSYTVDANTGALSEIANSRMATGTQPFEVLLHRTGKFAYVANVGSANISAYAVDPATGVLSALVGSPFATNGVPGDVTTFNGGRAPMSLHPNGRLLFVRSTVAKTLSVFTIDPNSGALSPAPGSPYAVGDGAVMHSLDPTGHWLFVANRGTVQGPGSISVFAVDADSGALTEVSGSPFALSGGPDWVSVDPSGTYVYACSSATDLVYSFKINQTTGVLTALDRGAAVVTGDYPLLVLAIPSFAPSGAAASFKSKFAYVPASDNSLYGYTIDANTGKLTAVPSSPVLSMGAGLAAAAVTPDGKRVYTVNTASNFLSPYDIDPTTGSLALGPSMIGVGGGPTLLAFDAGGESGYVVSSYASTLIAYPVDSATGMFNGGGGISFPVGAAPVAMAVADSGRFVFVIRNSNVEAYQSHPGTVATPPESTLAVSATADALAVHPSGRFVYVADADASGTIQAFSVTTEGIQAGALTSAGSSPTGSVPTAVALDPTGHFLYTTNGGSNDISGFSVDETTGALTSLWSTTVPTGHHPIAATVDYTGRYLFVVSDTDSSVTTYTIDSISGALAPVSPATVVGAAPKGLAISRTFELH